MSGMKHGDIMTMPGLPKVPAAEKIDIDSTGVISVSIPPGLSRGCFKFSKWHMPSFWCCFPGLLLTPQAFCRRAAVLLKYGDGSCIA